jgi:hypothetical protein
MAVWRKTIVRPAKQIVRTAPCRRWFFSPSIWMRRIVLVFVASVGGLALATGPALAYPERAMHAGIMGGVRSFEKGLDLEPDAAFGLRVGLGLDPHVSILFDYVHTAPARKSTGKTARINGLRGLVQYRPILGAVRPYFLLGVGGTLFDFDDATDTAVGTVTGGGGLDLRVAKRVRLFAEASADFYRHRDVLYSTTGEELSSSVRSTDNMATFLGGVSASF